ncbi:hypothetical protein QAD02_021147 [Eretmocerus hayati]|uniref:Uncharacterized protein n=1 Tax=Eretmocerus hayati TaxID=131215 RepID=A0ACC2PRY5_9HYME|nr:hypothetical protein QAD02_021147 [Eretmocerus hayati]
MNVNRSLRHSFFNSHTARKEFNAELDFFKTKLLQIEIEDLNIHSEYLIKEKTKIENQIKQTFPSSIADSIAMKRRNNDNRYKRRLDLQPHRKFQHHLKKLNHDSGNVSIEECKASLPSQMIVDNCFKNLSDLGTPRNITGIVSLSPKFSYSTELTESAIDKTIKNVESILESYSSDEEISDGIRCNVNKSLNSHSKRKTEHIKFSDRVFPQKVQAAKIFSKENDVLFTEAYEGNVTEIHIEEKCMIYFQVKRREKCVREFLSIVEESQDERDNPNHAIFQHTSQNNHNFDFQNPELLDVEPHWRKRIIPEMININMQDNPLNVIQDAQN